MKVVLQRVNSASVVVEGECVGKIPKGLLLLVGFGEESSEQSLRKMVEKISNLRIFPDEKGRFDRSVIDINGGVLLVPQFTLYGDTSKGRRPEFFKALEPKKATELFDQVVEEFKKITQLETVQTGIFGADMKVSLENDGPVTLIL